MCRNGINLFKKGKNGLPAKDHERKIIYEQLLFGQKGIVFCLISFRQ